MEDMRNGLSEALGGKKPKDLRVMIGIDGFVDEIIHVVRKRFDFDTFDRVDTIAEFGERISRAAGLSANIEFVPVQVKLGGNGPIFANALLEYGAQVTYVGSVGKPDIHPVFKSMAEKSDVYSLCDPGHTDALEFNDGKLMLGKIEVLNEINWAAFKDAFGGAEKIAAVMAKCGMISMSNWTMVPHMNEVWQGIVREVFPLLPARAEQPLAFFDLADPEKRSKGDILEALMLIQQYEARFRTALGLNEKEAFEIADVYGIQVDESLPRAAKMEALVTAIYEKLGISCLVVHPTMEAMACTAEGYVRVEGPFCEKPVLTTGAGDNFNAGFCLGQTLGLSVEQSLLTGVSTSGFYVRNAKSPCFDELKLFLKKWANGTL